MTLNFLWGLSMYSEYFCYKHVMKAMFMFASLLLVQADFECSIDNWQSGDPTAPSKPKMICKHVISSVNTET